MEEAVWSGLVDGKNGEDGNRRATGKQNRPIFYRHYCPLDEQASAARFVYRATIGEIAPTSGWPASR